MSLKLSKREKKTVFHLPVEQAVYVPSTKDKNKPVSKAVFNSRVKEVKRYLSNKFGGYTAVKGVGGYHEKKKGLIQEKVVRVVSFSKEDAFKKNKTKLMQQLGKWSKKWGQDSMGYEHEGDMYYVGKKMASARKRKKKLSPSLRKKLLKNLVKARRVLKKRRKK